MPRPANCGMGAGTFGEADNARSQELVPKMGPPPSSPMPWSI